MTTKHKTKSYKKIVSNYLTERDFPEADDTNKVHSLIIDAVALYENYYLSDWEKELEVLTKEIKQFSSRYGLKVDFKKAYEVICEDLSDPYEYREVYIERKKSNSINARLFSEEVITTICAQIDIAVSIQNRIKFIKENLTAKELYFGAEKKRTPSKKTVVNWFFYQLYMSGPKRTFDNAASDIENLIKKDHFVLKWLNHLGFEKSQLTPNYIKQRLNYYSRNHL